MKTDWEYEQAVLDKLRLLQTETAAGKADGRRACGCSGGGAVGGRGSSDNPGGAAAAGNTAGAREHIGAGQRGARRHT